MKKTYKIVITAIVSIIILYLVLTKLRPMILIKSAIKQALQEFDPDIVQNAERIYRLETNHFKSGQFKGTWSPGMEKFGDTYPYGWNTLNKVFWSKYPEYRPSGFKPFTENATGKTKYFLVFPSFKAAFYTLCGFLVHYGNNPGRWFSLDTNQQQAYNAKIVKFTPTLTNENLA